MHVTELELLSGADSCELRARVTSTAFHEPRTLWFRFPLAYRDLLSTNRGDPFVAGLLLAAMKVGEPLEIRAPVSPRLLRSLDQIQSIYRRWDPKLSEIEVRAPARDERHTAPSASGVGLFFSFGLDSFYTLLRNIQDHPADDESITHLVLIHGFDMRAGKKSGEVFPAVLENADRLSTETGKEVVVVHSNARDLISPFTDWGTVGHGAFLAAVGLCLEGLFKEMHIAATWTYDHLLPWGSHPLLDPLWSTERLAFVHDGCESARGAKAALVSESPIAMETLRVCQMLSYRADPRAYNCGACDKCVRTMISLYLHGTLEQCATLPNIVRAEQLRTLPLETDQDRRNYEGILKRLGSSELDLEIQGFLQGRLDAGTKAGHRGGTAGDRPDDALQQELVSARAESARLRKEVALLRQQLVRAEDRARDTAAFREKLARARHDIRRMRAAKIWRLATRYRQARAGLAWMLGLGRDGRSR